MKELSKEQKANKVVHFRRVIKYRSWFGWLFTIVGGVLFGVGMNNLQAPMVILNGGLFFCLRSFYGLAGEACSCQFRPIRSLISWVAN